MAQREVDSSKFYAVAALNKGDKVKLNDGSVAEFVRLKQKNFSGTIDGVPYNIPVNMFVEVVEKVDIKAEIENIADEVATLKKGDAFYIDKNGAALLFIFEGMNKGKIVGFNPIGKVKTTIARSMYAGKVADI